MVYRLIINGKLMPMLTNDDNLFFLKNKIEQINVAVFRAELDASLQLPNNIISTLRTDSEGNIWFLTSRDGAYSKNIFTQFFAYLDYCQNDQGCRLRLSGKATIEEGFGETEISAIQTSSSVNTGIVLIKFKILYAEYFENEKPGYISIRDKVKMFLTDFFIPHSPRVRNFPDSN